MFLGIASFLLTSSQDHPTTKFQLQHLRLAALNVLDCSGGGIIRLSPFTQNYSCNFCASQNMKVWFDNSRYDEILSKERVRSIVRFHCIRRGPDTSREPSRLNQVIPSEKLCRISNIQRLTAFLVVFTPSAAMDEMKVGVSGCGSQ